MKFLYVKINDWFEFEGEKYKKVGGSYGRKNNKGDIISFLKSSRVEPTEPYEEKQVKLKKQTPVIVKEEIVEEEKGLLEELNE